VLKGLTSNDFSGLIDGVVEGEGAEIIEERRSFNLDFFSFGTNGAKPVIVVDIWKGRWSADLDGCFLSGNQRPYHVSQFY